MSLEYTTKSSPIATDAPVYIGIDVHKNSLSFVVMNAEQEVIERRTTEHGRSHVVGLIRKLPGCQIKAAFEAGPTGYKLYYWLKELGVDVRMVAPSLIPERQGVKVKTDPRDAEKIARLLCAGMLDSIHVLTPEQYEHRELVRTREQIRDHRTSLGRQIKSKLLFHGIEVPDDLNTSWTNAFVEWLETHPTDRPTLDVGLMIMVQSWKHMKDQERELGRQLEALAEERYAEDFERMTSVPGIGLIGGMTLILEVGDWDRFDNERNFNGYTGLVPSAHNTGETTRNGPLIRQGNKRIRTTLVEAAWRVITHDARMRRIYEDIKARSRASTAIVAVARRLGLAIRAMMRDETFYEYEPYGTSESAGDAEDAAAE